MKRLKEKAGTFWNDFKDFAFRGNVFNLAVGVIIGGSFGKITTSLVNDIIMPVISVLTGKVDFKHLFIALDGQKYPTVEAAIEKTAVIAYGSFIMSILDFLIMALCIFVVVKWVTYMTKPGEEKPPVTVKKCPYCFSEIHIDASRCPNCTSELAESVREAHA